jgi:dihydropyrimidine dehydrogenase (NAD+) subunit PreT
MQLFAPTYDHLLGGGLVLALLLVLVYLVRRRREDRRARKKLAEAVRLELDVPASLHPVIDPDVCIGSGSCISACPEGKILGLVDGVATLVNASKCIGHGKCAAECPVGAIKLVFGSAQRGVDLPEVDEHFETSRPGVHIVGELAGMGLIRNALIQGLQVAGRLGATLRPLAREDAVDVAIVGAGPAGIATAVGCRAAGLSFALVEQDTVGGAVAHYPRHKLVMTAPVDLPYYGRFGRPTLQKEDLVAAFGEVLTRANVKVHEQARVTAIDGEGDAFVVTTSRGVLKARRVVLAIGRRGTPRRLGVPGEDAQKVAYRLVDPTQYTGKRVLVVGGGDSALEAAIMLAEESDAEVAIAYRRPEFARCRPQNKQRTDALLARKRIRALMSTEVLSVEPESVTVKNGTVQRLPNDFVIACLGGELPGEFLQTVGVGIRRHTGTRAMANPALAGKTVSRRREQLAVLVLFLLGAAIVAALAAIGYRYYLLPRALRYKSPEHALLKPSGLWGHGIGILATVFMLLNFVYPLRKRLSMFKGRGSIAPWLRLHVFVGIMSPLTILFHTAFQWGNQLATLTYISLMVVVGTGLVGRYIYGWVRVDPDAAARTEQLGSSLSELTRRISAERVRSARGSLSHVLALAGGTATWPRSMLGLLLRMPGDALRFRLGLHQARPLFLERVAHRSFCRQLRQLRRLRLKGQFHRPLKRLMAVWRVLHVILAVLLLVLIGLHVWVSVRVGFRWIWS